MADSTRIKRHFTLDELEDLDPIEVGSTEWRHGRKVTYVAEAAGAHWRFVIPVHHSEGWQDIDDGVDAVQVRQVERTVKVWEAVE